jgi:ribosomal protein S18 acetylase RimI-like enzyme
MCCVQVSEKDPGRVEFRAAAAEDAPALRALVDAAYGHYVDRIRDRPKPMDADYDEVVRTRSVAVAEAGGEIVGLIVHGPDGGGYLIDNVAVAPGRQGEGIGRDLIGRAERSAARAGFDTVRLYTHELMTENRALYERLGYVEYGERPVLHGRVKLLRKAVGGTTDEPA